MEKILVIGKNGNLGSEIVRQLEDKDVTAWDREDLDVTKRDDVLGEITELKPALVFNCAAFNNVDAAETDPGPANSINGYAPGYLAEACKSVGAILVHYSSDYVFDGASEQGYNEDATPNPISAYGRSKVLGEGEVKKNTDRYYIIRTSWLFGKKGPSELAKPGFVDTMLALAKTKPELKVVVDEESRPTFIADLVKVSIGLIGTNNTYGTYHVVNEGKASWYELAQEALRIAGINTSVTPVPGSTFSRPAKRPRYSYLNNTKLPKLRFWQEALREYVENYRY